MENEYWKMVLENTYTIYIVQIKQKGLKDRFHNLKQWNEKGTKDEERVTQQRKREGAWQGKEKEAELMFHENLGVQYLEIFSNK